MKFDIKYLISSLKFQGKGWVFVNDAALIFQGNMPKFNLGDFATIYKEIISVSTTRTVPYATIIKYKKPSGLLQAHEIIYRLPNSQKVMVKFQMTKSKKRPNEIFTSQLEEYLAIAQSFVIS